MYVCIGPSDVFKKWDDQIWAFLWMAQFLPNFNLVQIHIYIYSMFLSPKTGHERTVAKGTDVMSVCTAVHYFTLMFRPTSLGLICHHIS